MTGSKRKGIVLQPRDHHLFAELDVMRVIDREMTKAVAGFGSTTQVNTRLLELTRAGLLRRFFIGSVGSGRKAMYTLSSKGVAMVGAKLGGIHRTPGRLVVGDRFVEHQTGINQVYLAVKYRPYSDVQLSRWLSLCREIQRTNEFLESLERIEAENTGRPNTGPRRYAVSSLFLHESFKKLTADQDEQFFFITGSEVEGVLVLDQAAEFAHQRRSRLGVVGDIPSTHNLLIKLEQFGHKFLAHFHSHPGKGADATRPSGTDENFQKRLESGGHLAVMAIFSRDGFVRFIRLDQNLELEIYGEGVENHAPGIYRLTNLD